MRNQTLLFIALVLLILISLSGAYAENPDTSTLQNNSSIEIPNQNSTSTNSSGEMKETVINGTVNDCKTKNPFPGVNITISDNSKFIASTITKADGTYYLSFLSNHTNFNVTASHVGHYSVTKEVTVSFLNDSSQYGTINFQLGNTIYVNEVTGEDSYDGTNPIHTGGSVGPKKTLKAAISVSHTDGIISIAAGTYKGSDNRQLTINSTLSTFIIMGEGSSNTTIDAEHNDWIFKILNGVNITIQNLTLKDGKTTGNGSCIFNEGNLTLESCALHDNYVSIGSGEGYGGAIYNTGTLNIIECDMHNNHAANGNDDHNDGRHGGAIYNAGTLIIQNSNIYDNQAGNGDNPGAAGPTGAGGHGGAVFNVGNLTILNSTLRNNTAGTGGTASPEDAGEKGGYGGAIYNEGNSTLQNCEVYINSAGHGGGASGIKDGADGGYGGAIYNTGNFTIQNSNFLNNTAGNGGSAHESSPGGNGGDGGAIYNTGSINITISLFDGNYAGKGSDYSSSHGAANGGNGGTVYNKGSFSITNSEIRNSRAGYGGSAYAEHDAGSGGNGGAIFNNGTSAIVTITNCTLNNNTATNGSNAGTTGSVPGNAGNGGAIYNNGTVNAYNSNITCNYAGKGGDGCSNKPGKDGGSGGAIYNLKNLTLQNCFFDSNYAGEGGASSGDQNGGDGGYGGAIYSIDILTIENCTISNNRAGNGRSASTLGSEPGTGGYGGGIYIEGTSTISDSIIHDNIAGNGAAPAAGDTGSHGGYGGGIYNKNSLTIQNCAIYNNKAGAGGNSSDYFQSTDHSGHGGYGGGIFNEGHLTILQNSTIYGNIAGAGGDGDSSGEGGYGGGIYNNGTLSITGNSTNPIQIYSNVAGNGGEPDSSDSDGSYGKGGQAGGVYNTGNSTIVFAIISNNTSGRGEFGGNGGAIYNTGNLTLEDTTISGNKAIFNCKSGVPNGSGGNGGGIYNTGHLTITTCPVINNNASNGPNGIDAYWKKDQYYYPGTDGCTGGSGGGIYNTGTLNITESSVNNNSAGKGGNGGKGEACYNDDGGWGGVSTLDPGNGGNGGNGGGIFNSGNIVSITNATINNNQAGNGGAGGLYNDDISALEHLYQVTPGIAGIGGNGGGIYSPGNLTSIQNTTISNNHAGNGGNGSPVSRYPAENGNTGGNGGGIVIYSSMAITNCQISNNKAGNGGKGGDTSIPSYYSSTEPGNGGNGSNGGGIYLNINNNSQHTLTISNCTFDNNSAGDGGAPGYDSSEKGNGGNGGNGGGIVITRPTDVTDVRLTIEESTITNNQVGTGHAGINGGMNGINGVGGGLYSFDGQYSVSLCRIVDNTPQAMYINLTSSSDPVFLTNNWWGSNSGPIGNVTGSNILTSYYNPWLILTINATPTNLYSNQTSNVNASIIMNSNGINTLDFYGYDYWLPDGIPVIFGSGNGTMGPSDNVTDMGSSSSTFTPIGGSRTTYVSATVDYQTVTITLDITGIANVVLSQTGGYVKDVVTFVVTATNDGPDEATEINIKDLIPFGLSDSNITASTGNYNIASGIWTIPSLASGINATLTIRGNATVQTTVYNNATKLNQTEFDPDTPDTTYLGVYVPGVNVGVFLSPWYILDVNRLPQYMYSLGNTPVIMWNVVNSASRDDVTGVVAELIIPKGFEYVGSTSGNQGTISYRYDAVNQTSVLTWNIGYMPQSGSAITYVTLRVNTVGNRTPDLTLTSNLINIDQFDVNRTNDQNITCAIESPASADIQVNQTYVKNGIQVKYIITVQNNGPSNATGVNITDILPSGVTWDNDTSGETYNYNKTGTGAGIWNIGNISSGETKTLEINVKLTATTGTIRNTAKFTTPVEKDSNYDNNGQSTYITLSGDYTENTNVGVFLSPWYILQSSKKALYMYSLGNTPVIMWNVVNSASRDEVTGVVAELIIPKGFEYVGSTSGNQGTISYRYDAVNQTSVLTWNIGYMPQSGNAMAYITLRVNTVGNRTPDLTLTSNLIAGGENDINHTNDQNITCAIESPASADIQVNQTYTKTDSQITYTITVQNNGPSNATGVKITDILPASVTWLSDTSSGSYNHNKTGTDAGVWNIGTINNGQTKTLTINVTIDTNTNGTIINTAKKTEQTETDSNNNNNNNAQTTYITIQTKPNE